MGVGKLHRLLRLLILLQGGRARGSADLMKELSVSRRTLFRDLNSLQFAGIPYYHEPGVGYRISRAFFLPPTHLTVPETLGLMLLGKAAAASPAQPLIEPALSAIAKLTATVPEPVRSICGDMLSQVSVVPRQQIVSDHEDAHYKTLQRCIDEGRRCQMVYKGPGDPVEWGGRVDPYVLHFSPPAWYFMGKAEAFPEVRTFKLARVRALQPTLELFSKPRNYKAADKIGAAWQLTREGKLYDVELLFSAKVATNVCEVRWHASQKHETLPDGRARVRFTVDGVGEIAWWVCGYADQVEVIQPAELRRRVRDMLREALAKYEPLEQTV